MFEKVFAEITLALLKGEEPDIEALYMVIGNDDVVLEIIAGIKRGINTYANKLNLGDYNGT